MIRLRIEVIISARFVLNNLQIEKLSLWHTIFAIQLMQLGNIFQSMHAFLIL